MAVADLNKRVVEVLVARYKGRKRRDEVRARCPLHGGKHGGTFAFNLRKRVWQCFKCDARGGIVQLARALGILTPQQDDDRRKLAGIRRRVTATRWLGMGGATDREVLLAMIDLAMRVGKAELSCSERQLAELAGVGRVTAGASLKRLRTAGWLARLKCGAGLEASTWRLRVPKKVHRDDATRVLQPPEGCNGINSVQLSHDGFRWRALGKNARRILELLAIKHWRIGELAKAANLHRNTVSRCLDKCARHRVVKQTGRKWSVCAAWATSLDAVARECGTDGDGERARSQHAAERFVYRWQFEGGPQQLNSAGEDVIVVRRRNAA